LVSARLDLMRAIACLKALRSAFRRAQASGAAAVASAGCIYPEGQPRGRRRGWRVTVTVSPHEEAPADDVGPVTGD
jgi:hypothetical protein